MTDKNTTRQKLVNSMRKTKAGIAAQADASVQTDADTQVQTSKSKKPVMPRVKPTPSPTKNKPTQSDAFQSSGGRRVWPD